MNYKRVRYSQLKEMFFQEILRGATYHQHFEYWLDEGIKLQIIKQSNGRWYIEC